MPPARPLLEPPTPGPWTVYRAQRPPERLFIHGPKGVSVAMVFEQDNVPGWENAHLMASAPDLVDLLVDLLSADDDNRFFVARDKAAALLDLLGVRHD